MNFANLFSIENRKVIITGGTRGIGKAIVGDLIADGAEVSVVASNDEGLHNLKDKYPEVDIYRCNLQNEKDIDSFCNDYLNKNEYCDILINNAGIDYKTQIDNINNEDFYKVYQVNLFAPFLLIKQFLPSMKKRRTGTILNIASTLGTRAAPGVAAYSSSKAALIHFTRCLSIEVAPFNIRANCISPGFCKTGLNYEFFESEKGSNFIKSKIPMQRLLREDEIIPIIRLAISDAGSYMTGANIIVDGGVGNW